MGVIQKAAAALGLAGAGKAMRAAVGGGLEAGQYGRRLANFVPTRSHVNTLVSASGSLVSARTRYLARNNSYAANAVESFAGNIVGAGITPTARVTDPEVKARIQALWLDWTDEADASGITDFYGLQRRIAREVFLAGECFVRFRPRRPSDGLSVPLQLQIIPSEMCPIERTQAGQGSNQVRQGIEFNTIGQRVAYHFWRRHPGDVTDQSAALSSEITVVPASEIIHVFDPVEADQIRGLSKITPAVVKLYMLDAYDDAEIDRKRISSMFAGFIRRPTPEAPVLGEEPADDVGVASAALEPGTMQVLLPGEDITFSTPPASDNSYEAFQYRTLLAVSAAMGVPYASVTGDMVRANYSNTRAAMVEFRRRAEAFQHSVMVHQLCRPVWDRWIRTAVLAGALDLPGFDRNPAPYLKADWLPPPFAWVDPKKDIEAEILAINAGLKSRTQAVAERGDDVERLDKEIAADRARERSLGLDFAAPAKPAAAAPPPADAQD